MSNYRDPHPHTSAIRAQIDSLIRGHSRAEFHAHVEIRDLTSVPILGGEFAVKWRFRGVVPPKGKERQASKEYHRFNKGKGKAREASCGSVASAGSEVESFDGARFSKKPTSSSPVQSTLSLGSTSSTRSNGETSSSRSNPLSSVPSTPGTPCTPLPGMPGNSSSCTTPGPKVHFHSHDRGITKFVQIEDFTVSFRHTLDVILSMYIDNNPSPVKDAEAAPHRPASRDKDGSPNAGKLLPSPLKLVIYQKVRPNDVNAPPNPRIGAVYLDLAEYADPKLGPVKRKHLLMESKTNAILELIIHLTPRNVPKTGFKAPPLRAASLQSSLANLLLPRPPISIGHSHSQRDSGSASSSTSNIRRTPNITKHSIAETEAIIEAVFNPWPTSTGVESPFTYQIDKTSTLGSMSPMSSSSKLGLVSNGVPTVPASLSGFGSGSGYGSSPGSVSGSPPIRGGGSPLKKHIRPPPIRVESDTGSSGRSKSSLSHELRMDTFGDFEFDSDSELGEEEPSIYEDALDGEERVDSDSDVDLKGLGEAKQFVPSVVLTPPRVVVTPHPESPAPRSVSDPFPSPTPGIQDTSTASTALRRRKGRDDSAPSAASKQQFESRDKHWWNRLGSYSRPGTPTQVS